MAPFWIHGPSLAYDKTNDISILFCPSDQNWMVYCLNDCVEENFL